MADEAARETRTRRQKLEAMASQDASPAEAEVARAKLETMPPPRTLSRAQILGAANLRRVVGLRRVYDPRYASVVIIDVVDEDESYSAPDLDWDGRE